MLPWNPVDKIFQISVAALYFIFIVDLQNEIVGLQQRVRQAEDERDIAVERKEQATLKVLLGLFIWRTESDGPDLINIAFV